MKVADQEPDINLHEEFYDPSKPLTKDHYDAQQRTTQKWQDQTNKMLQMKQLEDHVKKNISIVFWKEVCMTFTRLGCTRLMNRPMTE